MDARAKRIGDAITGRREELGLSQQGVVTAAIKAGAKLSIQNLRIMEGGKRTEPKRDTAAAVAKGLRWPEDALYRIADGEDPATLETVEWPGDYDSPQAAVVQRLARVEQRLDRLEGPPADLLPLSEVEQALWGVDLSREKRVELIRMSRGGGESQTGG